MWLLNEEKTDLIDIKKAFAIQIVKEKHNKKYYAVAYFLVVESDQYRNVAPKQVVLKSFSNEKDATIWLEFLCKKLE